VARLAQDRADQQTEDAVFTEIKRRLKDAQRQRGDFLRVYPAPASGNEVPDESEARLVILGPEHPHTGKATDSPARAQAAAILDQRSGGPRRYRNTLVFLAPDRTRLADLDQAVRQYLAWKSIWEERETLNLDAFGANQARTKSESADETVRQRLPETFQWLLVPVQDVQGPLQWEEVRLQGDDPLAVRASKRLRNDGALITQYGAALLRHELDRIPLWRGDHVELAQLWDDFAQYLYLPRLQESGVLLRAVQDGVGMLTWESDTFAYAESWDAERDRYLGLRAGSLGSVSLEGHSVLVKPEAARRQLDADAVRQERAAVGTIPGGSEGTRRMADGTDGAEYRTAGDGGGPVRPEPLRRYHGSVELDATRTGRDAGRIAEQVIVRLLGVPGAKVRVTMEIDAEMPDGAPEAVVKNITEDCRTLHFDSFGFEAE
jgi:hypothetical protein